MIKRYVLLTIILTLSMILLNLFVFLAGNKINQYVTIWPILVFSFSSSHFPSWFYSTNNQPDNSVKVNGELFLHQFLLNPAGFLTGQNLHQSFAGKLSHQIVLKKNDSLYFAKSNFQNDVFHILFKLLERKGFSYKFCNKVWAQQTQHVKKIHQKESKTI